MPVRNGQDIPVKQYKYWIALEQSKGIGPAHLKEIHKALISPGLSISDLFELSEEEIKRELGIRESVAQAIVQARSTLPTVEEDYFDLLETGIEPVLFFEEGYPKRLHDVMKNEFPPILYTYGNKSILGKKGAAVLGESGISQKGELIAYLAAQELSRHRITVLSGFARGADLIAHRAALENGGETLAVLPMGFSNLRIPDTIKQVYDPERILLVSPYYFTREFSKYSAYGRNRIICALSSAVYIVESPVEGGVFEAGKSAKHAGVPLYVTEYSRYPESASGNTILMGELGAQPVRGRVMGGLLMPNLDRLIGDVKYGKV